MSSHFSQLNRPSASGSGSIKRSYEQFGLDHDNNSIGSTSNSQSEVSNRNKRARSEGRSSEETETASSGNISQETFTTAEEMSLEAAEDSEPVPLAVVNAGDDLPDFYPSIPPVVLPPDILSSHPWPTEEEDFAASLENLSDFERNIAVLRRSPSAPPPRSQQPPTTEQYLSTLDYERSPPGSLPQPSRTYMSWGTRLQQEQQSRPHSSSIELNRTLDGGRTPYERTPSPSTSLRPLAHVVRLPLPRSAPDSRWSSGGRSSPPNPLSLQMLEQEHSAMAALDQISSEPLNGRDDFGRGHLPSFARYFENLRSDRALRESAGTFDNNGWIRDNNRETQRLQETLGSWPRGRDPIDFEPIDNARPPWFNSRPIPTPSNTLMSESADQRRRRIQQRMIALDALAEHAGETPLPRRAVERLRSDVTESSEYRMRFINHPVSPPVHDQDEELWPVALDWPSHEWQPRWSPPTIGNSSGAIESDEALRRRHERTAMVESLTSTITSPPTTISPTHRSLPPTALLHHMLNSNSSQISNDPSAEVITSRPNLLSSSRPAIFRSPSPPITHRRTSSRFLTPPAGESSAPLDVEQPSGPASVYRDINLSAYQPGPFRASLERFREIDRMRDSLRSRLSQLDSIVGDGRSERGQSRERDQRIEMQLATRERDRRRDRVPVLPEPSRPTLSRREQAREHHPRPDIDTSAFTLPPLEHQTLRPNRAREWEEPPVRARSPDPVTHRPTLPETSRDTYFLRRRPNPNSNSPSRGYSYEQPAPAREDARDPARDRREMHSLFTRRPRLEASRIDEDITRPPPSAGQVNGFNQALEVLRGDGLSSQRQLQLIDRFHHRERTEGTRGHSSLWGEIERSEDDNGHNQRLFAPRRTQHRRDAFSGPPADLGRSSHQQSSSNSPTRTSTAEVPQRAARAHAARRHRNRPPQFDGYLRLDHPGLEDAPSRRFAFRFRNVGDYVRDEDFDDSFESLMNLTATLGEVKSRRTPEDIIGNLPSGLYKDWATTGCDQRCPICLDDYQPTDPVLKISDCSHWLHKDCLEQWLHGANTCPVCRKRVKGRQKKRTRSETTSTQDLPQAGPSRSRRDDNDSDDDHGGNGLHPLAGIQSRRSGAALSWFYA